MPGTGDESIVVNSWNNTGSFYVRVTGRGGAFDTNIPFTIGISKGPTTCTGVTDTTLIPRSALAASGLRTVILTDSSKVALDATLPIAGGGTLRDKLSAFAARTEIMGVLVDVASDARVSALKQQAANNPACPFAKNLVAEEIKGIVDTYRANPLRYIVIVGNDDAIPFFRSPDQSGFGDESSYVPPVQSNSASEASLRLNFVLSQDRYGSTTSISLPTNEFPVPRLAVGRLIETATEIAGVIDAYVAVNGVVVPGSALVTGYDFLEDAANAVSAELQSGIGRVPDALITPNGKSPQDPLSWTATQLRQKLLGSRHDVIFLAGHFSANSALAADFSTSLLTTDLVASTVDLTNSIVFSAGCHSGYNLVDTAAIPGVTLSLDWAQAFARKKSTLVAGTGYQYGDTDFLEYSERLYNRFARQLRAGTGAIAVGEALVKAKIDYLTATPDIRGIHEKVLLEATLFGLPMLGVNMPSGRGGTSGGGGVITPSAVASGPAHELGLKTYDLGVSPSLLPHTVALKNVEGGPNIIAHWLSGPDGVVTKPGEPALPLAAVNVTPTDPNIVLRGVGFRGGAYVDSLPLFPFSGAPTTELRGVHVPFLSPVFFPGRMWSPNYFGALAGSGGTDLLVTPAQHRAANIADGTSTQRKFTGLDLRLYYSGNLSQAALSEAPSIVGVDAQPDAGGVLFAVQVIGDPAAAIHQVWITYTSDGVGAWTSVDLSQCVAPLPAVCGASDDSRLWKGRLASAPTNARFLVQAVSGVGLVATDDNRGAYYGLAAATPAATAIALVSPPTSAAIGDTVDIKARLTFAGVPVIGKLVTIAVGDAVQLGTTGSDGSVTVKVLMATDPGTYQIAASFAGDDAFQPCSTTASFVVGKAVSSLAALTPAGATLTGVLGGNTEVLQQEAVAFSVTGPAGPITISAITDYVGRAKLPPPGMLAGTYTVTQASFGGNATYAAANVTLAQQFIVAKTAQSITFDALAGKTLGDPDFPVFATASSGLAVSFAANGTCTVLGNTVHIAGVGSCTITATQGGDANNNPAPQALRSFAIAPVNTAAPTVTSLVRAMPSPAMVATVSYTLTFGKPVTGVASGNFALVTAGIAGASIATISGIGTTWTVSVNSGHGTGSLRLDLINGTGISDAQGNALAGTPFTGQTYQIDKGGTVIGTGEGQPVPGFGSSGYALFSDVQTVAAPSAIAVLADGRILAAGGIGCQPGSSSYCTLQIAQYLASGAPDTAFGTVGRMLTAVTNINPELSALIVNADGTFFVNGSRNNGTAEVPFAAKFTSAGAPVTTFGTNGLASLDSLPLGLGVSGSAIDGSGRIVIAGTTPDAGAERNDIFVTRLTGAGAIDATFGNNGIAQFAISTVDARSDRGTTVAVQPNGMIVVGGRTLVTSGLDFDFLLLRLDATGALDSSFGNGGIATTRFAGSTGGNFGRKLVLQPDGKIALVGSVIVGPSNHCGVARFNANGTLDNTFGSGGHVLEAVTLGCFDVSLRTDGKLVIVASDQVAGVTYGTILRLLPAGAPDGAFGNGGFLDISSFGTPGRAAFTSGGNLVTSLVIEDPADGVPKSYVVQLGASGGSNQPPVADAGPDQTVTAGATVQMTSAGSGDPEGNPLSYVWSFTSKPNASTAHFSNSNAANPTFIADKKGTYVAQLIVNDGGAPPLDSAPDTVQITATNRAPVAVADSYSVAQGGTLVVSAATGMLANDTDADGDTLTAASVSTVTHGALTLNPDGGFTYTPSATYTGPDSFTYRANDGASNSNTATVSLSVTTGNLPPVADAGANQNVTVGQSVQLNGTCTDADGDATTRAWSFTSKPAGSTAALSDPTVVNPSFIPDLAGSYQLRLICNDGHVDSSPSPVTIAASTSTISAGLASPLTGIGQTVGGTITLSTAAPVGGVQVTVVSSDTGVATVAPSPVTVAAGTTTGSFTVTGVALGTATLTASATGYTAGSVDIAVTGSVTVTNTDDSGVGSLRDAIAQANLAPGPNTIDFAPGVVGTILLTSGQIRIDGPLTIVGPGRDVLAIDGNQSGRIFTIIENNAPACPALSGPSDFVVSISGLTLQNGSRNVVDSGGGAIQSAKSLVLAAVTIRDSQAKSGGGLVFNAQYPGQTLTIANSKFIDNVAKPVAAGNTGAHNGGALLVHDYCPETRIAAVVTISGSEFSGNRVQPVELEGRGGGIAAYLATGFVTISDTRIVDNHVEPPIPPVAGFNYPGGGVQTTSKSVTIQRSEIAGNSADYGGGFSVTADASDLQAPEDAFAYLLVDSTVSGNVANQSGGGINVHANVTAVIANSTVNGNAAPANRTGGIRVSNGPTFPASAINSTPPTLTLVSSIVANNSGADIGGLPSTFIPSPYTLNSTDSLIGVDPGPDFFVVGNVIGGNPQLAALAFNGGPTRTHALLSGSPAIDAGSNPLGLTTDQRGAGFPREAGARADIGAYEAPAITNHAPVANAGSNQNGIVGQPVQLNGSCTDADGDTTTRTWSFTSKPVGSTAALSSATILNPTFTPDLPGSYQLQLICNDGHVDSSPSSVVITVAPNAISLTPASPLLGVGRTINGTITLPQPAPAGGVAVALSSANIAIATVAPSLVTIPGGSTTGSFTVTGVALGGPVTLTGSAAGFASGTTSVTVTNTLISLGTLPAIGLGQNVSLPISLTAPAPAGGVTVNFTSNDTSIATVTASVFIAAGQTIPVSNPQVNGVNIGSAQITALAPGFAPDTRTANVQVNVTFTPTTLNVVLSASQNITVNISAPAPAGGLTVGLTTANPAIATVASPVTIPAGQLSAPGRGHWSQRRNHHVAGYRQRRDLGFGDDQRDARAGAHDRQSDDRQGPAGAAIVVVGRACTGRWIDGHADQFGPEQGVAVDQRDGGRQRQHRGDDSGGAAVEQHLLHPVTVRYGHRDSDGERHRVCHLGEHDDDGGVGLLQQQPGRQFYDHDVFDEHAVPRGVGATLRHRRRRRPGRKLRGGLTVSVPVTVVDVTGTNVGSITVSPVVFNGGDNFKDTAFDPLSAGTAQISVGVPAGFSTPLASQRQITATVTAPALTIGNQTIGKDLQVQPSLSLGAPAPAGGLMVTLTSSDPSKVLLSTSATAAGSASITVTIPAGQSSNNTFFIQSLSDTGTATVTASATGYATSVSTMTMAASGFYNSSPGGNFTTTTFSTNTLFRVAVGAASMPPAPSRPAQELRGGLTVSVPVTVVDVTGTNVGSITVSPVVFNGGDNFKDTAFDPLSAGTAQISVGVPAGFSTPLASQRQITATVTAPALTIGNQTIGKDLQVQPVVVVGRACTGRWIDGHADQFGPEQGVAVDQRDGGRQRQHRGDDSGGAAVEQHLLHPVTVRYGHRDSDGERHRVCHLGEHDDDGGVGLLQQQPGRQFYDHDVFGEHAVPRGSRRGFNATGAVSGRAGTAWRAHRQRAGDGSGRDRDQRRIDHGESGGVQRRRQLQGHRVRSAVGGHRADQRRGAGGLQHADLRRSVRSPRP